MNASVPAKRPVVFLSYSHDDDAHRERVLRLAHALEAHGLEVQLDQFVGSPPEGWPQWMNRGIKRADFVLVVCTAHYYRRAMGEEVAGVGRGVKWESLLTLQQIYDADSMNDRFIPLRLDGEPYEHIPDPLRPVTNYPLDSQALRLEDNAEFETLYRRLTNQPAAVRGPRGDIRILPPRPLTPPQPPESIFLVPYPRNEFFTGREGELKELAERLETQGGAVIGQAISGLGGIGKTQTAVEFAYRQREKYRAVLWLRAETTDELRLGTEDIARELKLPFDEKNPDAARLVVLAWLEKHPGWLLIFDNADTPELLKPYWPKRSHAEAQGTQRGDVNQNSAISAPLRETSSPPCHVLLTSRARVFSVLQLTKPLEMPEMPRAEAVEFLRNRLGIEAWQPEAEAAAGELAEELGGLPLALEQAAAYVEQMQVTLPEYLAAYRARQLELLNRAVPATGDYPHSVANTWFLNFKQVRRQNPATADLLRISGWLAPDDIPFELWTNGIKALADSGLAVASYDFSQPLALNELLQPAARYSLLTIDQERHTYKLHPLVQAVWRARLSPKKKREMCEYAVQLAAMAFSNAELHSGLQWDRLVPHIRMLTKQIEAFQFCSHDAALLPRRLGSYLYRRGLPEEAEPLYRQAREIDQNQSGKEKLHPSPLEFATRLLRILDAYDFGAMRFFTWRVDQENPYSAKLCWRILSEFIPIPLGFDRWKYKKPLESWQKLFRDRHPQVVLSPKNLAVLLDLYGAYNEAEPLYRQELEISRKNLGEEHVDFAKRLNDLAGLLNLMGRYDEAEPLYRQSLEICRKCLGEEHPSLVCSLNNLAALLDSSGRYDEAELQCRKALEIARNSLGEEHPVFVLSLWCLAEFLFNTYHRLAEALPMQRRAVAICQKSVGPRHPLTKVMGNQLAAMEEAVS